MTPRGEYRLTQLARETKEAEAEMNAAYLRLVAKFAELQAEINKRKAQHD